MKQETYISMISAIRPIFNFIASSTKFTEKNRLQTIHRNSKFSIFNVTHSHHLLNLFAIAITMSINYCWVRWLRFQRNRTGKDKQLNKYFFDLSNSLNVLAPLRSLTHHIFFPFYSIIFIMFEYRICALLHFYSWIMRVILFFIVICLLRIWTKHTKKRRSNRNDSVARAIPLIKQ